MEITKAKIGTFEKISVVEQTAWIIFVAGKWNVNAKLAKLDLDLWNMPQEVYLAFV